MILAAAPHRMMFLAGLGAAVASGLWWLAEMAGRLYPALALPAAVVPMWLHGWLMLYGLLGAFIFGFLFTTFPRWQAGPALPRWHYATVFLLAAAGMAAGLTGPWLGLAAFMTGVGLLSLAWALGWAGLLWVMLRAERIVPQAAVSAIAIGLGIVAQLMLALALWRSDAAMAHASLRAGLWACLLPLVYAVCHRMLPFFSQSVIGNYEMYRPLSHLVAVTLLFWLHLALAWAGALRWLWLADLPLLWLTVFSVLRWEPLRSRGVPMLWTLYLAYLWLPLGLALQLVADLAYLAGGEWALGRAPMHALGIGFLMSLTVAMGTRVMLGHSGRRLWMDGFTLACFAAVQLAAVMRVLGELLGPGQMPALLLASAALWLGGLLPWAWRHAPMLLAPRADGKAG